MEKYRDAVRGEGLEEMGGGKYGGNEGSTKIYSEGRGEGGAGGWGRIKGYREGEEGKEKRDGKVHEKGGRSANRDNGGKGWERGAMNYGGGEGVATRDSGQTEGEVRERDMMRGGGGGGGEDGRCLRVYV